MQLPTSPYHWSSQTTASVDQSPDSGLFEMTPLKEESLTPRALAVDIVCLD